MALVTDERLYGDFPPQPALRIASAVFDFGDSRATDALDAVLNAAADAAATSISTNDNVTVARQTALAKAGPIVQSADVAAAFDRFMNNDFTTSDLDAIAAAPDPASAASTARGQALTLTNNFYQDRRAVDMVDAVVNAIQAAGSNAAARTKAAHNTASSFADVTDNYQRFIAGKQFGDMIIKAADAAATATTNGSSTAKITEGVNADPTVDGATLRVVLTPGGDQCVTMPSAGWSAIGSIKENVIFAQHNLAMDGSFNEFNVILCRNVMIYFNKALQARVHHLLYESLVMFGILALGDKESLKFTSHESQYEVWESRAKLYRKLS
jgi:hypothetical protein